MRKLKKLLAAVMAFVMVMASGALVLRTYDAPSGWAVGEVNAAIAAGLAVEFHHGNHPRRVCGVGCDVIRSGAR